MSERKRDVVLVVDDSPETLRMLTDALDQAGMTVMVALDGSAAMKGTAPFDLDRGDAETVIAQDEERPARRLTGPVAGMVTAVCALVAGFTVYQVFWPLAQATSSR